jgi:uncharacterized protein YjbI with pentapeptide repeats
MLECDHGNSYAGTNRYLSSVLYFSGKILRDVDFSDSQLWSSNFAGADLTGADLSDAELRFADLSHANLRDANLSNVRFQSANLNHTNFQNAEMFMVKLSSIRFDEYAADTSGTLNQSLSAHIALKFQQFANEKLLTPSPGAPRLATLFRGGFSGFEVGHLKT